MVIGRRVVERFYQNQTTVIKKQQNQKRKTEKDKTKHQPKHRLNQRENKQKHG